MTRRARIVAVTVGWRSWTRDRRSSTIGVVDGIRHPVPRLRGAPLVLITVVLAGCGAGGGTGDDPLEIVAEYGLGRGSDDERRYPLSTVPGPRIEVLTAPSQAPLPTPGPLDQQAPLDRSPDQRGVPSGQATGLTSEPTVAWVDGGRYLGVIAWGSSSCPSGPDVLEVVGDQEVEIGLAPRPVEGDACSADVSGHVVVVELPAGISPAEPLTARFADHEVTIEAA